LYDQLYVKNACEYARVTRGKRTGNLADHVFQHVKREIVENRLAPDTILAEGPLAARFHVRRAPAREALKRLAELGFVRGVPRVGYIVTSVGVHDYDEIFQMRLVLEPLAAELAVPRLTDADAERLDRTASEVAVILELADTAERGARLAQANAGFHREIARISDNRRLERTIGALIDELERVMRMLAYDPSVESVADEHARLVRVMRGGDAAGARRLMREQLQNDYELMRPLVTGARGVGVAGAR
jgi:DNA-binding GntR family transcriptional regulator